MSVAGIVLDAEIQNLRELQKALRNVLEPAQKAVIVKDAIKKAIEPTYQRLRQVTPIGPTGNLKRAVGKKIIGYSKSGNAVGLVGYKRAGSGNNRSAAGGAVRTGSDRAFHQWWVEFGTQSRPIYTFSNTPYGRRGHLRRVKGRPAVEVRPHVVKKGQGGYIASSFRKLGPFKMVPMDKTPDGTRVQTDPPYPNAFFKKSAKPFEIRPMLPGGLSEPPLRKAWNDTKSTVADILQKELRISLEKALETLTFAANGTL